jgi:hypothetical protein
MIMDKLSSCQVPKQPDEYEEWWKSLTIKQKIAEFERWLTCPCDTCALFRELIGEERIKNAIDKAKKQIGE